MAMFDETTIWTLSVPTPGLPIALSNGHPFAAGSQAAGLALMTEGHRLMFELEVTTSFATANSAVALFGIVTAENEALQLNPIVRAFFPASVYAVPTVSFQPGLSVNDLKANQNVDGSVTGGNFRMHCVLPPFSAAVTAAGTAVNNNLQRWLGLAMIIPNFHVGGNTGFTAGAVKMRQVDTAHGHNATARHVAAGFTVA